MANKTVIDELIVKLGLDPSDFKKGQKEAAGAMLETEQAIDTSAKKSSGSITKLAGRFLTLAAAILVVKKAWNFVSDAASETRALGINAANFGLKASELRNYANAVEQMGGSAEEATRTVGGFAKAMFDLAYQGTVSDSLVMLARLGVQFQDSSGKARSFKDVLLDTAGALETAQKNGTMTRESAFQYAQAAGFDSGSAQLALLGRAGAEAELAKQNGLRQVGAGDVGKATEIDRSRIGREQSLQAAGVASLNVGGGAIEAVNNFATHVTKLVSGQESLTDATKGLTGAINGSLTRVLESTQGINNPGNLRAVGNQPHDSRGFRLFRNQAEGIIGAHDQLERYSKRGINTIDKIIDTYAPASAGNDVVAYKKDVTQRTGIKGDTPLSQTQLKEVEAAMLRHESGNLAPTREYVMRVLDSAQPTPSAQATQGGRSATTDVQIDAININTQATDATGVARDIHAAMQRKLTASQIDAGQH